MASHQQMTGEQESLLDDLLEADTGLTGWEVDFLDNLDQHWRERELTDKQAEKLHDIARKAGLVD